MGVWYTELIGYGGTKEILYGVGVLCISILLYLFRRIVQDKQRPHWREDARPTMPAQSRASTRRSSREGGAGRPSAVVRIRPWKARGHPSSRSAIETAISAPEAFGASFDVAPRTEALELGEGLEGDPAVAFRRTLGMFATGVTVLTTRVGRAGARDDRERVHVGLAAAAARARLDRPPREDGRPLHEGTRFGVSVLEARQTGLSDRFAGRAADDLPEATFELIHETPLVEGALAHLVARVVRSYWGGDHSLFLGQVEFARYGEGRPLLFHGGRYERLIEDPRVFSLLPRELLDPILALGEEREYADGEAIMRIGEAGCELLLVVEGSARSSVPASR